MTAEFVPLVTGAFTATAPAASVRLKPISAEPKNFQPASSANLPTGAKANPETAVSAAPAQHIAHGPPKVTVERQGETITHIRVECSCGQVTELKCEY
jgi:hypothetical protein